MSAVRFRAPGLDALRRRLAALPAEAEAAVRPAMEGVAEDVAAAVRASLVAGAGPSAPGHAPHDPSGRLAASVSATATDGGSAVTVAAPEAVALEYGTLRMAARPFLRPAAQRAGPGALARLAAALRDGLRR